MKETYLARHPLPYLGVTRRSKATVRLVDRMTSPVRLRACGKEEIPFAFGLPKGYHGDTTLVLPIHARDGGFWAPFPSRGGLTSRDTFTAFLEGAPDEDLRHNIDPALSNLLARTPLLASCRRYNLDSDPGSTDGPADLRAVIHRDETRAAVALQAFLDARVILADEHAYVRVRGPVAVHRWGNTYGMSFFHANQIHNGETPLRMDEVGRHFEWYRTRPLIPQYEIDPSRVLPKLTWTDEVAIPAVLPSGEHHAWLVANEMPDLVNHLVERTLNAPMRREFADAIARFKVDAVWGSIGDIAGPDALAVLTRARDLAGSVAQRVPTGGMAHLYHYLDGFLLPPLLDAASVHDLDEEDADALTHLIH